MFQKKPVEGQLKVWWIPQVPGKAFNVNVATLVEAKLLLNALAEYDLFQLKENIKPDYANAGGLAVFADGEWGDWYSADADDFDTFSLEQLREMEANQKAPKPSVIEHVSEGSPHRND